MKKEKYLMEMELPSGHFVEYMGDEEKKQYAEKFSSFPKGLIKLNPGGWCYAPPFVKYAQKVYEFKFRPTDIVILSFPKCGTHWLQDIVWTMTNNVNFDNKREELTPMMRAPFIEVDSTLENWNQVLKDAGRKIDEKPIQIFTELCPGKDPNEGIYYQLAKFGTPDPRILKSHLPFSLLPSNMIDTCKIIYIARNPKDVIVSYFHHHKIFKPFHFNGNLDEFLLSFINDKVIYGPFWQHIKQGWERKKHNNMLWIFYEDMKEDPMKEILRLDKFLDTKLSSEKLKQIVDYTTFEAMKNREKQSEVSHEKFQISAKFDEEYIEKEGGFFRLGKVGGWRDHFTDKQNEILNKWIETNENKIGIKFQY